MRIVWALALLVLTGCSTPGAAPPPAAMEVPAVTPCVEPRPVVCTLQYAPVCATLLAGGVETYPSGCNACADPAVAGYREGACVE